MPLRKDPVILAELAAREQQALCGTVTRTAHQRASIQRSAAASEKRALIDLMARRDALPSGVERDRLTREINDSQQFIERRLARAAELSAPVLSQAAE